VLTFQKEVAEVSSQCNALEQGGVNWDNNHILF